MCLHPRLWLPMFLVRADDCAFLSSLPLRHELAGHVIGVDPLLRYWTIQWSCDSEDESGELSMRFYVS